MNNAVPTIDINNISKSINEGINEGLLRGFIIFFYELIKNWKIFAALAVFALILRFIESLLKTHYGKKSVTHQGEIVKSKAEKTIANLLNLYGISYEYEKPLYAGYWLFKHEIAKPDFYLPDYDVYIEYWGLLGTDKKYEQMMRFKMKQYYDYGIKFISIYPDNLKNLDWILKKKFENITGHTFPLYKAA